ncbi:MAG: LamB/YcsF family protein [Roseinatronobacter sp.]
MSIPFAVEVFTDRGYDKDGMLMDRRLLGALLHDRAQISERVIQMIRAQAIKTAAYTWLPCQIDTICVHGDNDHATIAALALREHLHASGIRLAAFGFAPSQQNAGLGA